MKRAWIAAIVAVVIVAAGAGGWTAYAHQQDQIRQETARKAAAEKEAAAKAADEAEARTLDSEENLVVANFNLDVASVILNGSRYGELLESTDAVIALARKKPDAVYSTTSDRTMRQVIGDAAGELARYQPAQAKKLELALETLPPQ